MILKAFVELDVHFNAHAKEKISLLMAERGTIIQKFNFHSNFPWIFFIRAFIYFIKNNGELTE